MDVTEIQRLRPEQLVEVYEKTFKTVEPFERDALLWVARVSGGVFRRFKRYVRLCLEDCIITKPRPATIDLELSKKAVPPEVIAEGLTPELEAVFPKGDMKDKAKRLLAFVYHMNGTINQKQLAEHLGLTETDVGRIITRLEPYGYFRREATKTGKVITSPF